MDSVLAHYAQAEFEADWAQARELLGDAATASDLPRTDPQRRADALAAIHRDAAAFHAARPGGSAITTDLVIDQPTFERQLAKMHGVDPGPDPRLDTWFPDLLDDLTAADDIEPIARPVGFRCSTRDGLPVDPTEACLATLTGHVRRAVIGADSVVVDMGRRQRLFTGARQEAVLLSQDRCYWPGCDLPASRCQIDHLKAWADGGATNPANGAPACGRHNRYKEHGFQVHRDQHGRWHIHRPDGTEVPQVGWAT